MVKCIETVEEMKSWSQLRKKEGKSIGFVPTMGALHEGHLSLVRLAKQNADLVMVSIFVNPLQFGPAEDLNWYPRTLEKDLELLQKENVDGVFIPSALEIYPKEFGTVVSLKNLSQHLCGISRPGHFDGVATVVLKLFNIVQPDVAIFGNKDFQQRRIIEKMVEDFNLNVKIIAAPIVRELDGLAMSSRNRYLTSDERKRATGLYRSLSEVERKFKTGERNVKTLIAHARNLIDNPSPAHIDYVEICDANTLETIKEVNRPALCALAVYFGKTRLIDNILLNS